MIATATLRVVARATQLEEAFDRLLQRLHGWALRHTKRCIVCGGPLDPEDRGVYTECGEGDCPGKYDR